MKPRAPMPALLPALLLALALSAPASAATLDEREAALASRLRCMVCQNQTLAESNAPLARDMRQQIREQLAQGRNEQQVRDYFEARYGAFVRYDPPFSPATWLLWIGPFLLLGAGLLMLRRVLARQKQQAAPALSADERARAEALLKDDAA